jgi:threonine dehydrogenase-like Zn-dependent dehydrogenase
MKALAITPGQAHTARLVDVPTPRLEDVPNGRGVLVKVLQVGVDGTDKDLHLGRYGQAPPGSDFLVTGHESLGRVVEVGPNVSGLVPGDFVVATVRRPGRSIYDRIGMSDMTTDETIYERGISLLHGFTTEFYVDEAEFIVKVPPGLKHIGLLLEPMSIVAKGLTQAYEIQRRLKVWQPHRAAVMGAGRIGLLAVLAMRLQGLEVTAIDLTPHPNPKSALVEDIGGRYLSLDATTLAEAAAAYGPFDLIFEATGSSAVVFEAAHTLARNGVLIMASGSKGHRTIEVDSDRFNLEFVLGNKVMFGTVNAHRGYFEQSLAHFARAELTYPGWLARHLTHPVRGLENYGELLRLLFKADEAIKAYLMIDESS